jgi:ERF superfamily
MNEPAISDAPAPPAPVEAGASDPYLAMIERAARDPQVDLAKLQGLMAMKKEVEADRASIAFAEAFTGLQQDLPTIDRKGRIVVFSKTLRERAEKEGPQVFEGQEPQQKTPYATLGDILEAIRAPLAAHGFSLRFEHETSSDGRLATTAILRHRQGHSERATTPPLMHDSSGSKNNVQAVGSSLTYGRRYALMAVLPIVSHAPQDADDDGKAAGSKPIEPDEIAYLEQLIRDTDSDLAVFLKTMGPPSIAEFNGKQYKRAVALLNEKKRRTAADAANKKATAP